MSTNCFVATIDLSLEPKLRADLQAQGFTLTKPQYTIFQAKKTGVSCTLYQSGKLTVQGKGKHDFLTFYLEPEILGQFTYSYPTATLDKTARIGIDEAGKGDFFGPLCVAGVYADEKGIARLTEIGVKDSKTMSDPLIQKLARKIITEFDHEIISLYPMKYNELYEKFANLNRLLAWGHAKTIATLVEKTGCKNALIDQFAKEEVVEYALQRQNVQVKLTQRHKGESDPVVAAASMLARDAFLKGMDRLSRECEMTLPRGASAKVKQTARMFASRHGKERLKEIAKVHFKTYAEIN
jgi:ribonuclease HIII